MVADSLGLSAIQFQKLNSDLTRSLKADPHQPDLGHVSIPEPVTVASVVESREGPGQIHRVVGSERDRVQGVDAGWEKQSSPSHPVLGSETAGRPQATSAARCPHPPWRPLARQASPAPPACPSPSTRPPACAHKVLRSGAGRGQRPLKPLGPLPFPSARGAGWGHPTSLLARPSFAH